MDAKRNVRKTGAIVLLVAALLLTSAFVGYTSVNAQGSDPNCVPAIRAYPGRADNTAKIEQGEVLVMNVSRDMPSGLDAAGSKNESVVMLSLEAGVKWAQIVWDGAGYVYPEQIVNSVSGCQVDVETRQNNWPAEGFSSAPSGVFKYHLPYGSIEHNAVRWPDLLYTVTWEDNSGVHSWTNSTPRADALMTPMPVTDPGIRTGVIAAQTLVPTLAAGTLAPTATPDPGWVAVVPSGNPALETWMNSFVQAFSRFWAEFTLQNPLPTQAPPTPTVTLTP